MNFNYKSAINLLINKVLYSEAFYAQWYARKYNREAKLKKKGISIKEILSNENPLLKLRCKLKIGGKWQIQVILFSENMSYIYFDDCDVDVQQLLMEMLSMGIFTNTEKNIDSNLILYTQMMFDYQLGREWDREHAIKIYDSSIKNLLKSKNKAIKNIEEMKSIISVKNGKRPHRFIPNRKKHRKYEGRKRKIN